MMGKRKVLDTLDPASPNGAGLAGPSVSDTLRATRESLGYDLREVATMLRIRYPYLQAIEAGRYEELPGTTYAAGFLRSYAECLGLDPEMVIARYKEEAAGKARSQQYYLPTPVPEGRIPGGTVLLGTMVLAGIVYGGWYYLSATDRSMVDLVPALPDRLVSLLDTRPLGGNPSATAPAQGTAGQSPSSPAPSSAAPSSPAAAPQAGGASAVPPASPAAPAPVTATPATPAPAPTTTPSPAPSIASNPATPAPSSAPLPSASAPSASTPAPAPATGSTAPAVPAPSKPAAGKPSTVAALPAPPPAATPAPAAGAVNVPPPPAEEEEGEVSTQEPTPLSPGAPSIAGLPPAPPPVPPRAAETTSLPTKVYGSQTPSSRIQLRATQDSWIQVRDGNGEIIFTRVLKPGDVYRVPDRGGVRVRTGNAGGLTVITDGVEGAPLGAVGQVLRDVPLDGTGAPRASTAR